MSPVRVRARAAVIATVAVVWLIGVAGANGAAWQPSTPISQQGATVSDGAQIALGPSGDAAAGWADDVAGGRLVLARKRAGEGWSAPAGIPACGMAAEVFPAVDAAGDVTGACAGSSGSVVVVNWAAAATNPTSTPIPDSAGFTVSAVAMNAAGDAVFPGTNLAPRRRCSWATDTALAASSQCIISPTEP